MSCPRRRGATRILRAVLVVAGAVLLVRRFGPRLRQRCVEQCEHMMEGMPDSFPPKRMMNELEAIRVQNARIIELLEEDQEPGRGT